MEKNVNDMIEYPEEGIISKTIIKNNRTDIGLFCMAAGTEMSEHTSKRAGFIHVLEGKGVFSIGGKNIEMLPGILFFMREEAAHSLKAEEDTSFILGLI